ncbi:MAG: MaoC family dehydratase N-terminal domain-containing protein [Leptospiraceae bacterium]|nr:MaoC family dehydratase N-terminal domain-containing protein [Leptospiraceae bacterium]MCB1303422.1 MaoC family dehydratase N-terminal domain-containing protein [Leptospiraceae bacterium]
MKRIKLSDYEQGAEIPELKVGPIQHMDLVRYAGASGDFNPIHTDPAFAEKVGLGGTIAHGMYVMALMGRCVSGWVNPIQMKAFGVKFKAMTKPGQTITCTGKVKKIKEEEKLMTVAVQAADENGEVKAAGDVVIACD